MDHNKGMYKYKILDSIQNSKRIPALDVFRGIAILIVMLAHMRVSNINGNWGVEIFFVLSGFLVGGILIEQFDSGNRIVFWKFFSKRAFKILPSYYFFLLAGSVVAYFFYNDIDPTQYVPLNDLSRYLFFYQNYTGYPLHYSFDHVWSLCVEEHFYILLPVSLITIQFFKGKSKWIYLLSIGMIVMGLVFKILVMLYTNSKDTYSGTHNRIDALAWGILLYLIYKHYRFIFTIQWLRYLSFFIGISILSLTFYNSLFSDSLFFKKVYALALVPMGVFFVLISLIESKMKGFMIFRVIGYYSYNMYLWQQVFVVILLKKFDVGAISGVLYFLLTFFIAVIVTICIEEPFLKLRSRLIS